MTDQRISQLPAASTLTGDELLPLVQGGTTKQATLRLLNGGAWNVKWSGALGDGSTNDTAAIDAALALGGRIYFPAGTYMVGSLAALPSNVTLFGEGRGKSILKQRSADQLIFTATDKTNISILDLEIDGDSLGDETNPGGRASPVNQFCKFVRCSNLTIQRCYVHDFTNKCVEICSSTAGGSDNVRIEDNEFADIGDRNTSLDTPYSGSVPTAGAWLVIDVRTNGTQSTGYITNLFILRNKIHGSLNTLISVANTDYYWIEDNEVYDTDSNAIQAGQRCRYGVARANHCHTFTGLFDPTVEGRGFSIGSDNGVEKGFTVADNRIEDSTNYGIDTLAADDCVIRGNILIDIAQTSGLSRAGILARGDRVIIEGNHVVNPNHEGILRDDGDDGVIANNIITTPGDAGIKANSATATQRRTKIIGNSVSTGQVGGIVVAVEEAVITGNNVKDCNQSAAADTYGISLFGAAMSGLCNDNVVSGANHTRDINIAAAVVLPVMVRNNNLAALGSGAFRDQGSASSARNNRGHVTEASGTGSIASGATTAVITHGLSVTPAAKNISIIFTEQGSNDYGRWWISSITSTQFTLNVSADPGASNLDFSWQAVVV